MSDWMRFLLGLGPDEAPAGGETLWELSGLPRGPWLLAGIAALAGALALIVLIYRRERGLGRWQRLALASLRLGALALVVLILLNPRVVTETRHRRPGNTLVLLDATASMSQRDSYAAGEAAALERASGLDLRQQPARSILSLATLDRQRLIPRLEERNRVRLFAFAGEPRPLAGWPPDPQAISPDGAETGIGIALRETVRQFGGDPLAAIVLVTDGRSNAGINPNDLVRDPVEWRRVPVHAIGVGKVDALRNYSVKELTGPEVVEVDYPVQIDARVLITGIRGPVKAALHRIEVGSRERKLVEERILEPPGLHLDARLRFIDDLPRKGTYRYILELPERAEESSRRDNRMECAVLAVEEKRRLLLVAGAPSWEFQYVRDFFLRDDGIQASCWLSDADPGYPQDGDVPIQRLPQSADELRPYDAVILIDPDPAALSPAFQEALADFVAEQGGGLAYVAGEANTRALASARSHSRLLALVAADLGGAGPPAAPSIHSKPWRPRLTEAGAGHPLCRLADQPAANLKLWEALPPLYFAYPSTRLRPAAVGLLEGPAGEVLLAVQQAGLGEAVYIGSDDFRLWRSAGEGIHERFWAGVARYLALGKSRAGGRRATIETDRDRYREGDQVQVFATLFDAGRRAVEVPSVEAEIELIAPEDGSAGGGAGASAAGSGRRSRMALYPTPGVPGRYSGILRGAAVGRFQARIEPDGTARFEVMPVSTEWEDPSPDFAALEELAAATGGSFSTLADAGDIPQRIPECSVTEIIGRRAAAVWDSAALMLLFSTLVILEWVLRKIWRLN